MIKTLSRFRTPTMTIAAIAQPFPSASSLPRVTSRTSNTSIKIPDQDTRKGIISKGWIKKY